MAARTDVGPSSLVMLGLSHAQQLVPSPKKTTGSPGLLAIHKTINVGPANLVGGGRRLKSGGAAGVLKWPVGCQKLPRQWSCLSGGVFHGRVPVEFAARRHHQDAQASSSPRQSPLSAVPGVGPGHHVGRGVAQPFVHHVPLLAGGGLSWPA
jgi:hypothetical protein